MAAPPKDMEPRWPAMLALLAIGGLRLTLPKSLSLGPDWLMLVLVAILLVPTVMAHMRGNHKLNHFLGYLLTSIVTIDMAWSLFLLIKELPSHKESPQTLLLSAAALWITNILVFASWYWRLDAGGPYARELRASHTDGAFLFPQMTLNQKPRSRWAKTTGAPASSTISFSPSTPAPRFSPTDSPVLSRWAKVLMMIQSLISLATVALLAARAVNIL